MASSKPIPTVPAVSPHVKRLPSGEYVGYIEHLVFNDDTPSTESFVAGTFNDHGKAQQAACRLMKTFQESVLSPGLMMA